MPHRKFDVIPTYFLNFEWSKNMANLHQLSSRLVGPLSSSSTTGGSAGPVAFTRKSKDSRAVTRRFKDSRLDARVLKKIWIHSVFVLFISNRGVGAWFSCHGQWGLEMVCVRPYIINSIKNANHTVFCPIVSSRLAESFMWVALWNVICNLKCYKYGCHCHITSHYITIHHHNLVIPLIGNTLPEQAGPWEILWSQCP